MRTMSILILTVALGITVYAATGTEPQAGDEKLDVQQIVSKANVVAYYQGNDGKAKVKMVITDKGGNKREREFIILRKDIKDGGDQNCFVYFHMPADVRRMTYMVNKHAQLDKDDVPNYRT